MDYKTLLGYMEDTQVQIICRTREQRAEAVDILKELNPSLDTTFISQKYEASEFPYMGYDGVTDEWALWGFRQNYDGRNAARACRQSCGRN